MILGLPVDTWVLVVLATVPGFLLVWRAYSVHKGDTGQSEEGGVLRDRDG